MILINSNKRLLTYVGFNDGTIYSYSSPSVRTSQFIVGFYTGGEVVQAVDFSIAGDSWQLSVSEDRHSVVFSPVSVSTSSFDSYGNGEVSFVLYTSDTAEAPEEFDANKLSNVIEIGTCKFPMLQSHLPPDSTMIQPGEYYDQVIDVGCPYNLYVKNHLSCLNLGFNIGTDAEPSYYPGIVEVNRTPQGLTSPTDPHSLYGTPNHEFMGWVAVWNEDSGNIPNVKGVGYWIKWQPIPVNCHWSKIQANDYVLVAKQTGDLSNKPLSRAEVYGLEHVAVTPTYKRLILTHSLAGGVHGWSGSASMASQGAIYNATWTLANNGTSWTLTEAWTSQSGMNTASGTEVSTLPYIEGELYPQGFDAEHRLTWYTDAFVFRDGAYYRPYLDHSNEEPPVELWKRDLSSAFLYKNLKDGKFYFDAALQQPVNDFIPCDTVATIYSTPGQSGVDVFDVATGNLITPGSSGQLVVGKVGADNRTRCDYSLIDGATIDYSNMHQASSVSSYFALHNLNSDNQWTGATSGHRTARQGGSKDGAKYKYTGHVKLYPDGDRVIRGYSTSDVALGENYGMTKRIEVNRHIDWFLEEGNEGNYENDTKEVYQDKQVNSASLSNPLHGIVFGEVYRDTGGFKSPDYHQDCLAFANVGFNSNSQTLTVNYDEIRIDRVTGMGGNSSVNDQSSRNQTLVTAYGEAFQSITPVQTNPTSFSIVALGRTTCTARVEWHGNMYEAGPSGSKAGIVDKILQYQWSAGSDLRYALNGGDWQVLSSAVTSESSAADIVMNHMKNNTPTNADYDWRGSSVRPTPRLSGVYSRIGGTIDNDWDITLPPKFAPQYGGYGGEEYAGVEFSSTFPSHANKVTLKTSKTY